MNPPSPALRRDRARLKELLLEHSLRRGDFVLSSGERSTYYIDVKKTSMHPEGSLLIARLFLAALEGEDVAAVGGPVLGAAPLVGALAPLSQTMGRPLATFLVRKEAKDHGTRSRIEGCFAQGMRVALVEDVVTKGGSILFALEAVREAGLRVTGAHAVVDREAGGGDALQAAGVPFHPLFRVSELLESGGPADAAPGAPARSDS
jgi:orotate phosphoribosyltransferase